MINQTLYDPTEKSERIVVDEIFDDEKARILRAKREENAPEGDVSITTWGEEREEVVSAWRLEAFVGFSGGRKLREGDVFLIVDGTLFDDCYNPKKLDISRDAARKNHLLVDYELSRSEARQEIKKQALLLTAYRLAEGDEQTVKVLSRQIEQRFSTDQ